MCRHQWVPGNQAAIERTAVHIHSKKIEDYVMIRTHIFYPSWIQKVCIVLDHRSSAALQVRLAKKCTKQRMLYVIYGVSFFVMFLQHVCPQVQARKSILLRRVSILKFPRLHRTYVGHV